MKETRHEDILTMLMGRYAGPIMNNVCRGDYVECMVGSALGANWRLTWLDGWDWAAWDCEHPRSGARLEINQAGRGATNMGQGADPATTHPDLRYRAPQRLLDTRGSVDRLPWPAGGHICLRLARSRR